MVSHDIDRALEYATRVMELQNGKIKFNGKSSEFKKAGEK